MSAPFLCTFKTAELLFFSLESLNAFLLLCSKLNRMGDFAKSLFPMSFYLVN